VRGRPPADEEAIVDIVVRLSELVTDLAGELAEIDINPIIAGEAGAAVVDALVVLR